jgi:hypothetical protein
MTKLERTFKLAIVLTMLGLSAHGQNWQQATTGSQLWSGMAGSQTGSNLVAAVFSDDPISYTIPGHIYASTNGGQTWLPTSAPVNYWTSLAASTNGLQLVAGAEYEGQDANFNPGQIYISTNSSLTWAASSAPAKYWLAVGSSSDGQILAGETYGDGIFVSTNSGMNWIQSDAPTNDWKGLTVSADGKKMYATTLSGIYVSTNAGLNWSLSANSPPFAYSVVCSADGNQVFTGLEGGTNAINLGIYASSNGGATWSQTTAPISDIQNYQCLSMSTHGDILLAGAFSSENHGRVYLSTDGGSTWTVQNAPTSSWGCVFCSGDGSFLNAGEFGGAIYSAIYLPPPAAMPILTIKPIANQILLSWPVAPAGFQLQTTSLLNPASWMNITNGITTSGINYYFTNSLTAPSAFFRLEKP